MSDAFFRIHSGLPQEGPGSAASTRRALSLAPDLAGLVQVLDIACGPGRQTLTLADELPEAHIVAVDAHLPFVEEVRRRAVAAGVADRVEAVVGDMAELGELAGLGPFDAVWGEGAAYVLGFQEALEQWRPLLRPGGVMALTEPVWLAPTVRQAVSDFWTQAYPGMQPVQVRRAQILGAGYKRIGDFTLPREDWEAYYDPLRARLHDLGDDPSVAGVVADHERELAVFDGGGADTVGYQFFVMRPG